jgi:hypothetical protein
MMIVPALSLSQNRQTSLWSTLVGYKFNLGDLIKDFYIGTNGAFFVSLILQQAVTSSAFYLLNMPDLFNSYFSPWLAYHKRKVFQD